MKNVFTAELTFCNQSFSKWNARCFIESRATEGKPGMEQPGRRSLGQEARKQEADGHLGSEGFDLKAATEHRPTNFSPQTGGHSTNDRLTS